MTTPNPTLLIGLGGTGQLVVCQALKDIMELYDLHDNNLPPKVQILAIDTDFANIAKVDTISKVGQVGQVQLPNNMRVAIRDVVRDYAMQIKGSKHPEIASWFDADWFLSQQGNDALLNLSHGAGQYRPLGRIAVPYNMNVQGGFLKTRIENSIASIQNECVDGLKELNICITGSLCGGTGAGLCVDVAYLVKQLVGAGTTINLVGYLVLPQAFDKTVPSSDDNKRAFQRRAFAAMGELRRFAREVKYETGLPMYYSGEEHKEDNILRGKLRNTLFNLLYYFDGSLTRTVQDTHGNTQNIPIEVKDGVVPLIAEAILMWVDGATANEISSHIANLNAQYSGLISSKKLPENAAVAGAFGAYTLQLPIYHIVEGWTYELARRALRDFLGIVPANPMDPISQSSSRRECNK